MPEETIFRKIIDKEIPSEMLYQDEFVTAFRDISPQAPVHILISGAFRIAKFLGKLESLAPTALRLKRDRFYPARQIDQHHTCYGRANAKRHDQGDMFAQKHHPQHHAKASP